MDKQTKENLIRCAMNEAERSIETSNSPFGAVLTDKHGNIIESAYNTSKHDYDPTAHAEINLLRKAGEKFETRTLGEYCLFSNAESCSMCMSAAIKAGITYFYFGAPSEKNMDPYLTVFDIAKKSKHNLHIETGILKKECIEQITRGRNKLLK